MSAQETRRYAQLYASRGLAVVPIPRGQKNPILPSWQHLRIETQEVAKYFNGRPQNIGVLLGEPSSGVVDVLPRSRKHTRQSMTQVVARPSITSLRPNFPPSSTNIYPRADPLIERSCFMLSRIAWGSKN